MFLKKITISFFLYLSVSNVIANDKYILPIISENQENRYSFVVQNVKENFIASLSKIKEISKINNQVYTKYDQMTVNVLEKTKFFIGTPYVWGGNNENGVDCSGLVKKVYKDSLNIDLPRTSLEMSKVGTKIKSFAELKLGDLVFFNTRNFQYSHVGIYVGNNKFLHSPRSGSFVRIDEINSYWKTKFNGARRIIAKN